MVQQINLDEMSDEEIDALYDNEDEDHEAQVANEYLRRGNEYSNTGGFVTIYHTENGMPVEILEYMKRQTLKMRREDGKRRFSTAPTMEYKGGSLLCPLNTNHPNYQNFRTLGVDTSCPKATLRTPTDVRRHMQSRHKDENAVLQDYNEEMREQRREAQLQRQIDLQEQQIAMLTQAVMGRQPVSVEEVPAEPESAYEDPMFPQSRPRGRPKGS